MKPRFLFVWCWFIASAQCYLANGETSKRSTCTTYLGTVCKIYLGEAQIERSPGVDTITLNNITTARDALVAGGVTVNEGCLHFIIFSECVSTVQPCNGTVWCGQESKLQLLEIARQVCQCAGTEPCEEALSDFLASVNVATTYTQRSAAPAGTCQDTTLSTGTEPTPTDAENMAAGVHNYSCWIGVLCIVTMVMMTF